MFSVVIPVYNKADTLAQTIESVRGQSFGEWEMIVVDDGSTDDFVSAVAPFRDDTRIRVVRQPNSGVSMARNRGIELAREAYLAFLDADDEWLPNHLETFKRMIAQEPGAGLYSTGYRVQFSDGSFTENHQDFLEKGVFSVPDLYQYMDMLGGKQFTNTVASCVSLRAIRQCGGFQPGERRGEDTDFFLRIAAYFDTVLCGDVTAVYHRERSTATEEGLFDHDWYFQRREKTLLEDSRIPSAKRAYIRRSFDRFRLHRCRHYLLEGDRKRAKEMFAAVSKDPALRRTRLVTRGMMLMPTEALRGLYRKKKELQQE